MTTMLLPNLRQEQQRFLPQEDRAITSLSQARVYVGEFFEKATQTLLRADRLMCVTNADLCPDLVVDGRYLENKSIGKSGELIVRKGQLDREKLFTRPLYYVLWRHDAAVLGVPSREALRDVLAQSAKEVLVISATRIHALAEARPLIQWTQPGQTADKCLGHRIRWKDLSAELHGQQDFIVWEIVVDGRKIGPITVRCTDRALLRRLYR